MKFAKDNVTSLLPVNQVVNGPDGEYNDLHAHVSPGMTSFAVELSEEEIQSILKEKKIYVSLITFNRGQNPIMIQVSEDKFHEAWEANREWLESLGYTAEAFGYTASTANYEEK